MAFQDLREIAIPARANISGDSKAMAGFFNDQAISSFSPDYFTMLKLGLVYFTVLSGGNPSAFTGGAAGTPLVGLYNPPNSQTDIVVLQTRIGVRTTGTAAANLDFVWYGGPSVTPTGTSTVPKNAYSLASGGSVATAFINTAMTSSTAINLLYPALSVGQTIATTPTATAPTDSGSDAKGLVVACPGNLIALGCPAALTAASIDVGVFWAELPS